MQIANIACYSISDFINIIGLPKLSKSTKYRNHKSNAIEMTGLISTGLRIDIDWSQLYITQNK